jgi:hypothetical protein
LTLTGQEIAVEACVTAVSSALVALNWYAYSFAERALKERDSRDQSVEAICTAATAAAFESLMALDPLIDEVRSFQEGETDDKIDEQETLEALLFERTLPVYTNLQKAVNARIRKRKYYAILSKLRPTAFGSLVASAIGGISSALCLMIGIEPYPMWAKLLLLISVLGVAATILLWGWAELTDMSVHRLRPKETWAGARPNS